VDAAWGENVFSISQINRIVKAVKKEKNTSDQRLSRAKKKTGDMVASIAAARENDCWLTIPELAKHSLPVGTIHAILNWQFGPGK
jgi:hypothetical protein